MNIIKIIITTTVVILLSACTNSMYEKMLEKFVPKEESQFAQDYLDHLRQGNIEYIKNNLDPLIAKQATDEKLREMINYFPTGEVKSVKLLGYHRFNYQSNLVNNFTFEYEFSDGWALANAAVQNLEDKRSIVGINVYRTTVSQQEYHKFTLSNKTMAHYIMIILAVIVLIFIIVTTIMCVRTPSLKLKWLWILFILVGFISFNINWTTGQLSYQLIHIKLLGASATAASPYSAWIISFSIPVGAIVFWIRRILIQLKAANN